MDEFIYWRIRIIVAYLGPKLWRYSNSRSASSVPEFNEDKEPPELPSPWNLKVLIVDKKGSETFAPRRHNASSRRKGLRLGRHPHAPCCSWGKSVRKWVGKVHLAASLQGVHLNIWSLRRRQHFLRVMTKVPIAHGCHHPAHKKDNAETFKCGDSEGGNSCSLMMTKRCQFKWK